MSAFDKVIGYGSIKKELMQIVDMIRNKEMYAKLGAKFPHGAMLVGDPGLGKTLMAKCFIEESGLKTLTIRKDRSNGEFLNRITEVFEKAKENEPCIIFLDDLDKFANEDDDHRDADEYVAVQAGIDEVKDHEVFVIATVNDPHKLPDSLKRSGRFDRIIKVGCPSHKDAELIIDHYLSDKKISKDVNREDLAKMITYSSCAELETILNEAAINAAYERKDSIGINDLVKVILGRQYPNSGDFSTDSTSDEEIRKTALHEAGHLVVSEALLPGSVGFASIKPLGKDTVGGFIHRCENTSRRTHDILISLAGKAAVELYYAETVASGCQVDIRRAGREIANGLTGNATRGFPSIEIPGLGSESLDFRNDTALKIMLEEYFLQARNILIKNRGFLEAVTEALVKKETLLYSDIREIREKFEIIKVAV